MIAYEKPTALRDLSTDNHGIIAASACTGKTYTLQHLVIEILLADDEVRLDEILLVTFTVAATSDLKAKIRQTLEELVEAWDVARSRGLDEARLVDGQVVEDVGDVDEESHWIIDFEGVDRLRHALRNFDRASIYTIHGFCQRILVEHAFANRRLFEQEHVSEEDVLATAFAEMLREDIRPGTEAEQWLTAYLGAGNRIENLRDVLANYVQARGDYRPVESVDLDAFERFVDRLIPFLNDVDPDAWKKDNKPIAQDTDGTDAWASKGVGSRIEILKEDFLPRFEPDNPAANLFAFNQALSGKFEYFQKEKTEILLAQLGNEGQLLSQISDFDHNCNLLVVAQLGALLDERMETVKSTEGYFTFADMVRVVRNTLVDEGEEGHLLHNIRSQYAYGLIDEFQDTDREQWDIFSKVFVESPEEERHFLYLIGDPKQAIYGFRGGDVYTYLEACEQLAELGADQTALTHNYRSTPAVLDGCNAIFDSRVDRPVQLGDGINYEERGVRAGKPWLQLRGGDEPIDAGITALELTTDREDPSTDDIRAGLVACYADEIREIVDGAQELEYRAEDGDGDCWHTVSAEDIYVLCRRRADLHTMADALRDRGVPFAFMKMPGLFDTAEAEDVYDLLLALDDPYDRSRRARAWMTPFFDLSVGDIAALSEIGESHELFERLLRWSRLSKSSQFTSLFNSILEQSGLIRRRLLLERGERELTNYLHIFEILSGEAARRGQTVADLARRLKAFIDGRAAPEGEDVDQQRLETEEAAVQLMTIHGSKGLERGLVFVVPKFGSVTGSNPPYRFHESQQGDQVRVEWHASTSDMPPEQKEQFVAEATAEELRLAYVAVTRAELMAYVPYGPEGSLLRTHRYTKKDPFIQIAQRIEDIEDLDEKTPFIDVRSASIDGTVEVPSAQDVQSSLQDITTLDEHIADIDVERDRQQQRDLREQLLLRRWEVTSFSKLKKRVRTARPEDEKSDAEDPTGVLPGGMATGNFIHLVLEELDYGIVDDYSLDEWLDDDELREFFASRARCFGPFSDEAITESMELVYDTLRAPVTFGDGTEIDGLRRLDEQRVRRELEFLFPAPEQQDGRWQRAFRSGADIEGGFATGIVDLLFEHGGQLYFADWKSDRAHPFDDDALETIIEQRYSTQAILYSLAACRILRIGTQQEYRDHFGGYFYFFVRGMTPDDPGRGIYSGKVDWPTLVEFEQTLPDVIRNAKTKTAMQG